MTNFLKDVPPDYNQAKDGKYCVGQTDKKLSHYRQYKLCHFTWHSSASNKDTGKEHVGLVADVVLNIVNELIAVQKPNAPLLTAYTGLMLILQLI